MGKFNAIRSLTTKSNVNLHINNELKFGFISKVSSMKMNLGPQHPSMHGVLRLTIDIIGESVINVEVHVGLLHRGTEKLIEYKTYTQALPYMDRLDYVSVMAQEHAFSVAVEKLVCADVSLKTQIIRAIFSEITRILNHLLALTTGAMDVGAMTPFLWAFEEREKLMEFYERVSGARLHANYIVPGGVSRDLPNGFLEDLSTFVKQFRFRVDEIEEMLTGNRIFKKRLVDVGSVSYTDALDYGFSGPVLRASGVFWDLRVSEPYEFFKLLDFKVPVGKLGDCYDRYLIRVFEMRESLSILNQCIMHLNNYNNKLINFVTQDKLFLDLISFNSDYIMDKVSPPSRFKIKNIMESMIHHFKFFSEGYNVPKGEVYAAVESPKGEFGVFIVSDNSNRPYRCSLRSPDLPNLFGLSATSENFYNLADLVAIIASVDVVLGSTDG